MSTEASPPTECLAIAFLVEASFSLAYEWTKLFNDYIVHLLQRCMTPSNPNKPTRVAFITYGTADTHPSPIVKKTQFTELRYIMQDIKDDRRRLGIGQTDSGGGKGMAALEGFATVLDMFDLLRTMGAAKEWDFRVVHIAASPPDSSHHPHWNQTPLLDTLTWELLPAEFKKRNIQLTGINVSSGLPRFPELYTQSAAGGPTTPWFTVKSQHHLFINGFASTQPKVKRAGEPVAPDRSPEAKRPRVGPPAAAEAPTPSTLGQTPPTAPTATSSSPSVPSSTIPSVPQPPQPPQANSQSSPQPGAPSANTTPTQLQLRQIMQQAQMIIAQRKRIEEEMKALNNRKQLAASQGNVDMVNALDSEINKRKDAYVKLTQALPLLQQQGRRLQAGLQNASATPQGTEAHATSPNTQPTPNPSAPPAMARAVTSPSALATKDPSTPLNPNATTTPRQTPASIVQSPNQNQTATPARSISTSGVPAPTPPNPPPPTTTTPMMANAMANTASLNAQMQKLLQLDRNRPGPTGTPTMPPASTSGQGMQNDGGAGNNPNPGGMQMNAPPQPQQQQPQQPVQGPPNPQLVWEGTLSFNGTGSDGNRKEVHTHVSASSSNAGNSHRETWPPMMTLVPAATPQVSISEFQEWIRRTKPVLCTFKARGQEDEANYNMLVGVMSQKRIYATASWQLPNGSMKENVLIFPINQMGLCGAVFPLTGIPEMPKSANAPPPPQSQLQPQQQQQQQQQPQQLPAPIVALIQRLPPEQRAVAIAQIRARIAQGPEAAANFFRAMVQNAQQRAVMANQFGLGAMPQPGNMPGGAGGGGGGQGGPNMMGMMGLNQMNMNTTGANPLGGMPNLAMLQNMARSGGGSGAGGGMNVNFDALQSFMQRNNPDGNNGGLGGMGPG